jgi:ABC-type uncharacterized transport system permease subunit
MSGSFGFSEDFRALVVRTFLALLGAAIVGLIALAGAGLEIGRTVDAIIEGAIGSNVAIRNSLLEATPITITAIGVAVAFRAGLFNLGGQGQIYIGALGAVLVALYVGLPGPITIFLAMLAAIVCGAVWGGITGALRARWNLSEIITTIMFNFIAFWIVSYLVRGSLMDPDGGGYPYTKEVSDSVKLGLIGDMVPIGAILMVLAAIAAWVLMDRSRLGIRIKAIGASEAASRFAGVSVEKVSFMVMAIAGALGGMAGAASLLGDQHRLSDFFSPNWGFDAVATALIGRGSPIGTLVAGVFIGFIRNGIKASQGTAEVPVALAQILIGVVVLFLIIANADLVVRMGQRLRERFAGRKGGSEKSGEATAEGTA